MLVAQDITRRCPERHVPSARFEDVKAAKARQREVHTDLPVSERGCLYCLTKDATFLKKEHVIQRAFGKAADDYILGPGAVCDPCNEFLGRHVDAQFTRRYDIALVRGLEGWAGRGGPITEIEGRDPTVRLDIEIKPGVRVAMFASEFQQLPNGGFRARVKPKHPEPSVAVSVRGLWKIALGVMYGGVGPRAALDPEWDPLREAVLGAAFSSYLIQAPFRAVIDGKIDINIEPRSPALPTAVTFKVGGVLLAAPLAVNTEPPDDEQTRQLLYEGWSIARTGSEPPRERWFELEPTELCEDSH
jgi:hypothetical protein